MSRGSVPLDGLLDVAQKTTITALEMATWQMSSIEAEIFQVVIRMNVLEFLSELKSYYNYPLAKEVGLVWDFPLDLPAIWTDRGKLKNILQNLINNAIKFTDRGSVTIQARYIATEKIAEFKVTDTGIGIPQDQLSMIFEKFCQLDSSETQGPGGIRLGLYIVKKYADMLNASLHVESQLGQGSMFTLKVPCQGRETLQLVSSNKDISELTEEL